MNQEKMIPWYWVSLNNDKKPLSELVEVGWPESLKTNRPTLDLSGLKVFSQVILNQPRDGKFMETVALYRFHAFQLQYVR